MADRVVPKENFRRRCSVTAAVARSTKKFSEGVPQPINDCWPRGFRAVLAAKYCGCTPGAITAAQQDGKLQYRVAPDGARVSTKEDLDSWMDEHWPKGTGKLAARGVHLVEKAS
jgi:hypothetical protein